MQKRTWSEIIAIAALAVLMVIVGSSCRTSRHAEPFHIAFNEWVGFAPFYLAKEKGYFGDLEVDFQFIALEGDKRAGLQAGRFQMICETMDMFQAGREAETYPGKLVFAIDESFGGDGVLASSEIQAVTALKGKTVVAEPGSASMFVLQYLLHKEGMTVKELNIQDMNSSDAAAAFMAQKADVAGTYEPYLTTALQKRPGSHVLVSSKDTPGLIVDVAIVDKQVLDRRNADVRKVFEGWCRAMDYYKSDEEDAVSIMAKPFKLSPKEFKETISGIRYFDLARNHQFIGTQTVKGPIYDIFATIGSILKENDLTKAVAPASDVIFPTIVTTAK